MLCVTGQCHECCVLRVLRVSWITDLCCRCYVLRICVVGVMSGWAVCLVLAVVTPIGHLAEGRLLWETSHRHKHGSIWNPQPGSLQRNVLTTALGGCYALHVCVMGVARYAFVLRMPYVKSHIMCVLYCVKIIKASQMGFGSRLLW